MQKRVKKVKKLSHDASFFKNPKSGRVVTITGPVTTLRTQEDGLGQ